MLDPEYSGNYNTLIGNISTTFISNRLHERARLSCWWKGLLYTSRHFKHSRSSWYRKCLQLLSRLACFFAGIGDRFLVLVFTLFTHLLVHTSRPIHNNMLLALSIEGVCIFQVPKCESFWVFRQNNSLNAGDFDSLSLPVVAF